MTAQTIANLNLAEVEAAERFDARHVMPQNKTGRARHAAARDYYIAVASGKNPFEAYRAAYAAAQNAGSRQVQDDVTLAVHFWYETTPESERTAFELAYRYRERENLMRINAPALLLDALAVRIAQLEEQL